ncbi:OpgC family protein [Methylopila turkensis]|uniref:Membrane protein n=1 Tax=Methylopila turkensis TaxID=1437816 RepID=A0A9W6JLQ9_9HYPH|nr:OpgC domain-containing protein [Methylopila turkensis]GLK78528.1 membrane protein [Methylopila turkensis]
MAEQAAGVPQSERAASSSAGAAPAKHPSGAAPVSARDWRLDFWRGLAIVFIFWNHTVDNVMSWLTTKNFGVSDSAELFVFLSGFAMASMFTGKFLDRPIMAIPYGVQRAFSLYLHHITAFVVIATLAVLYREYAGSSVMERDLFVRPFLVATETVLPKLATLGYLPPLLDILPLYIILTLMIGVLFAAFRDRWAFYVGFAVVVWSWAQISGATLSSYPDTRLWTFNPFAWQAVFLSGFAAFLARGEAWFRDLMAAPATIALSITIVIVAFIAAAPWATLGLYEWRPLRIITDIADKANASPVRLAHFLAMAHLASLFVRRESRLGSTFLGRSMVLIGRQSLPLFVLSTVFAAASHGVFDWFGHGAAVQIAFSLGGAAILIALAFATEELRTTKRVSPPRPSAPRPEPAAAKPQTPTATAPSAVPEAR